MGQVSPKPVLSGWLTSFFCESPSRKGATLHLFIGRKHRVIYIEHKIFIYFNVLEESILNGLSDYVSNFGEHVRLNIIIS